jgi:hypothetical protein
MSEDKTPKTSPPPPHISDEVREDSKKLDPVLRAGLLRVADAPKGK